MLCTSNCAGYWLGRWLLLKLASVATYVSTVLAMCDVKRYREGFDCATASVMPCPLQPLHAACTHNSKWCHGNLHAKLSLMHQHQQGRALLCWLATPACNAACHLSRFHHSEPLNHQYTVASTSSCTLSALTEDCTVLLLSVEGGFQYECGSYLRVGLAQA
jgi:hypothetical protein